MSSNSSSSSTLEPANASGIHSEHTTQICNDKQTTNPPFENLNLVLVYFVLIERHAAASAPGLFGYPVVTTFKLIEVVETTNFSMVTAVQGGSLL